MQRQDASLFGSRVGMRIFVLMAITGLAPLVLTLVLAQMAARHELDQSVYSSLRAEAKSYGMGILSFLQDKADDARALARRVAQEGRVSASDDARRHFSAGWEIREDGQREQLFGNAELTLRQDALDEAHLAQGRPQLISETTAVDTSWILVLPMTDVADRRLLAVRITAEALWQPAGYLPSQTQYCIFTPERNLIRCNLEIESAAVDALQKQIAGSPNDIVAWTWRGQQKLSAAWPLFLGGEFAGGNYLVVSVIDREFAYRALEDLQSMLPPLIAAVVIFIILLSMRLIRRNLVPLRDLTAATQDYAAGNLSTRLQIDSNDEFGELGSAFNDMATRLDRQIDTLKTMSGVDDRILSGHSVDHIARHCLGELMRLFPVDVCAVCLADIENPTNANMLVCRATEFDDQRVSLKRPLEDRLTVDSATQSPYWTTAGEVGQLHGIPLNPQEWQEVLAIPMTYGGALRGLLFISTSDRVNFDEEKKDLCAKLASRLAIGVASVEREERLYQKAHYDDLTGLPNRQLLKDRLAQCLARTRNQPASGAVIFIDLDRFKEVNDVFGHSVGDTLIKDAAARITSECPDFCTVARLGGDEFVVLIPSYSELPEVRSIAGALIERLSLPFYLNGNDHILGASAGIALFPADADTVELILRNADSAMYRAKAAGRGRFEFFSEDLGAANQRRIMLERDLRHALKNDELQLFVQPQVAIQSGELRGAECLLRWQHPTLGYVSPGEFISIAEQSGLIVEIGSWLVARACKEWRSLLDDGLAPGILSINVSRRELEELDFSKQVFKALRSASIDADCLELEITESVIARDKEVSLRALHSLSKAGISIAIDDFGTGYSSLSFLRELPLNCIKIDQSFIAALGTDADAEKLCRTIIRMAQEMGKTVVAEGVEKQKQLDFLEQHGCHVAQGFLYARPMPVSEFADFVRAHSVKRRTDRELRAV